MALLALLYTSKELSGREFFFFKLPFTIASKGIKYLGINLTKGVKDLQAEHHKTDERN